MQEVMLRIHVRQKDSGPIKDMGAYLFRVATSVLADNARRAKVRHSGSHKELTETDHPVEELSPDRVLLAKEQLMLIMAALDALPERTRDIFMLRRFEQMPYADIARRYAISVSAIEKHVTKAMSHLLAHMQD